VVVDDNPQGVLLSLVAPPISFDEAVVVVVVVVAAVGGVLVSALEAAFWQQELF